MNTLHLIECLQVKQILGSLPGNIQSIEQDSRKVKQDTMFVCIKGYTVDGHQFIQEAIDRGATTIVVEEKPDIEFSNTALVIVSNTAKALAHLANRFYDYPSTNMEIIGVTGTNGKTSVSSLINNLLKGLGQKTALAGTNGITIDGKVKHTDNTTCDVLGNQELLKEAYDQGVEDVVMEVSSHGLAQGRVWGIDFDIAIFTNLTQDHLDYHQSMEQYGYIKGLLFAQLGNNAKRSKYAILNKDDSWSKIYENMTPAEVLTYSILEKADFQAKHIRYLEDKTLFTLLSPDGEIEVETKLLGEFNVYNVLAALAALFVKGVPLSTAVDLLKSINPIEGRMERIQHEFPLKVYIDYAHTPDAIRSSIRTVSTFKRNRLIYVAGTGGDRDKEKRPLMAKEASLADIVILTINDLRNENATNILHDMEKGMQHENYSMISDRKEAIEHAVEISEPGDILIIAGKGKEHYQIIGNTKHPHSDETIVTSYLNRKYNK
ncbi:UDP-N-acetylmuramoyl-L-alanyl-D-glutamate--2,6-diaminopimelate ligase [Oceanobacillus manasiensis]|uniref:UDP-N-acetylmuramoyl-L-alanyl-D-glutamate--2, 6-diaminopimelate ligase n=1 Tax=Oceanobacillus manasiensis TaxID=586413 RepID=UPI0005AB6CF0|nr:UDP-N-acetylmuramoyl-L-alanyl-D-glutamate--2,6-diaminopimelate ligase [Oceanobacillus manasiensis]